MLVRKAARSDLDGLVRVHVDTWRTTYRGIVPDSYLDGLTYERTAKQWETVLAPGSGNHVFLAEDPAGAVVGFANGGPNRGNEEDYKAELYAIYVLQAHNRRGVGRSLLYTMAGNLLTEGLDSLITWALADNAPARRFYENLQGRLVSRRDTRIGGKSLAEVAYGWPDMRELLLAVPSPGHGCPE